MKKIAILSSFAFFIFGCSLEEPQKLSLKTCAFPSSILTANNDNQFRFSYASTPDLRGSSSWTITDKNNNIIKSQQDGTSLDFLTYKNGTYKVNLNLNSVCEERRTITTSVDFSKSRFFGRVSNTNNLSANKPGRFVGFESSADGTYIAGIHTLYQSPGSGVFIPSNKFSLLKLEANGLISRKVDFVTSNDGFTEIKKILPLSDGGAIVVTSSSTTPDPTYKKQHNGGLDAWVFRVDRNLNVLWEKSFGGNNWDNPQSAMLDSQNNIVIVGDSYSSDSGTLRGIRNNGGNDAWIFKLDLNGNILWQKFFGSVNFEIAFEIVPATNGNYMIIGSTGNSRGWMFILNRNGDFLFEKYYTEITAINKMMKMDDNRYVFLGTQADLKVRLITVDLAGNVVWSKTVDGVGTNPFFTKKFDENTILFYNDRTEILETLNLSNGSPKEQPIQIPSMYVRYLTISQSKELVFWGETEDYTPILQILD